MRHWPALRAAVALAATPRWEEARAALLALDRRSLPRAVRSEVQVLLGSIESLLGDPEQALRRGETVKILLVGTRGGHATVTRWRASCVCASALATLGRLDEARRERDVLAASVGAREKQSGHGRSEFAEILLQSLDLKLAFTADAPEQLPDDNTLHSWARAALARTRFGDQLVSLAWAFHRRGDDEMARHLLAEAPSRIGRDPLPTTNPGLHAWHEERRRAWGLAVGPFREASG